MSSVIKFRYKVLISFQILLSSKFEQFLPPLTSSELKFTRKKEKFNLLGWLYWQMEIIIVSVYWCWWWFLREYDLFMATYRARGAARKKERSLVVFNKFIIRQGEAKNHQQRSEGWLCSTNKIPSLPPFLPRFRSNMAIKYFPPAKYTVNNTCGCHAVLLSSATTTATTPVVLFENDRQRIGKNANELQI